MAKAEFESKQQKYLWSLVKKAGWDKGVKGQHYSRFSAYLLKTFQVTHLNCLDEKELRQAIATLKPYAAKAAHEAKKRLHTAIMAYVAKQGKDIEWLHYNMELWGYSPSLRECSYQEVQEIFNLIKKNLN